MSLLVKYDFWSQLLFSGAFNFCYCIGSYQRGFFIYSCGGAKGSYSTCRVFPNLNVNQKQEIFHNSVNTLDDMLQEYLFILFFVFL